MNTRALFAISIFLVTASLGFALVHSSSRSSSARAPTSEGLRSVKVSAMSEDGKEIFLLNIFEPWSGAGRRVITFDAAAVSAAGLAALSSDHMNDVGALNQPLKVIGERYQCTATTTLASWADVTSTDQVQLALVAAQ